MLVFFIRIDFINSNTISKLGLPQLRVVKFKIGFVVIWKFIKPFYYQFKQNGQVVKSAVIVINMVSI